MFNLPVENKIATIDVDTKEFTSYTMPTPGAFPLGIATASDGSIWASETGAMKLARIDPNTGDIREFPLFGVDGLLTSLLDGLAAGSIGNPLPTPGPMVQASDGNIYFLVSFPGQGLGNQVARIDPVTHEDYS